MKKIFWLVTALLTFELAGFSCGNEYGVTLDGKRVYTRYLYLTPSMKSFDTPRIEEKLDQLQKELKSDPNNFKLKSDISVNLMKLGRADSALRILNPLLGQYPNEYHLMANLGTAYELTGKLDSALKYIKMGYATNPKSHLSSEWVHVKILEAKIKNKRGPGWIRAYPIIEPQFLINKVDTQNLRKSLREVNNEVFYQIRTRAPFTPAPNAVLANILISLGDFNKKVGTYENALLSYAYALEFQGSTTIKRRITERIRVLNMEHLNTKASYEFSPMFLRLMNRSKVDPELMLLGLDDYANQLDSIHTANWKNKDSLQLIKGELDSVRLLYENYQVSTLEKQKVHEAAVSKRNIYLIAALILVLVSIAFAVVVFKKRKNED